MSLDTSRVLSMSILKRLCAVGYGYAVLCCDVVIRDKVE